MNISAVLEDIEVEGYFASSKNTSEEVSVTFHERVRVVCAESIFDLVLPLRGKGFIAGFESNGSSGRWLVFTDYRYLEVGNLEDRFQRTSVNLPTLISSHLIHTLTRITLKGETQDIPGYPIKANKESLHIVTTSGINLLVPIRSIAALAVEKLSIKDKV
jgi:hypothetical protein